MKTEAMEYLNNRKAFNQLMRSAFAYADKCQDSQGTTRNERALEFCRRNLTSFPLMPPSMEYIVKEIIENPHLIMADLRACRYHVQKKGHCFKDLNLPKCSVKATKLRHEGNKLYAQKGKEALESALEKYNESICWAPNDSEDLGIGYGNRSAIYYEQEKYELAMANIALAKRHNYPERLMPKLMARERNCREKLEEQTLTAKTRKCPTLPFNTEANPRIPFLAKGISAQQLPIYGNSLVAEQGFKAGDVILHEKPLKICVGMMGKFVHCSNCLSGNLLHLIPCPNCTEAMFCNEECFQEGFKMHRFECGATAKMVRLNDFMLGPRMLFHGLTLFNDDVGKLMEFCRANKESGKSFFDLDYSNHDPLEEFKIFVGTKIRFDSGYVALLQMTAAMYYTMFMEIPLVRSLFTTEAQKDFMVQCIFDYIYLTMGMGIYRNPLTNMNGQLYPIASICNHSCDPNTLALDYGGPVKFVVLRPIRRGEQIFVSYGSHHSQSSSLRTIRLNALGFECACDVCDKHKRSMWLNRYKRKNTIPSTHWLTVHRVALEADVTDADRLNALQQFIQRYAAFHPQENLSTIMLVYSAALAACHKYGMEVEMRKKIVG